jgi:hypothetical protein
MAAVIAGCVWIFTHLDSPFTAVPLISGGIVLIAVLPWNLRHQPRPVNFGGRRLAVSLVVVAAILALEAIRVSVS